MAWDETPDGLWWRFQGEILVPKAWDPTKKATTIQLGQNGGVGNFPAVAQGERGPAPSLVPGTLTELASDDPTPASWTFDEITDGTYRVNASLHTGAKGEDGDSGPILDGSDYSATGQVANNLLAINSANNGVVSVKPRKGVFMYPASIATAAGQTSVTLCTFAVPAQPYDCVPLLHGQAVITGSAADLRADLVARLTNETTGNVVARGLGVAGSTDRLTFASAPPPGATTGYNVIPANTATNIYVRIERQAGASTFSLAAGAALVQLELVTV